MGERRQVEEFIAIEAFTESDAVHPRFKTEDPEACRKYEEENYYYCKGCNIYFAPTYEGLYFHFTKEIQRHRQIGSCFYCKGKVYEYYLNADNRVYHNCKDSI